MMRFEHNNLLKKNTSRRNVGISIQLHGCPQRADSFKNLLFTLILTKETNIAKATRSFPLSTQLCLM